VNKVDLHGTKHKEVLDVLLKCINEWETPFIVITGNSVQMKIEVANAVEQFGLSVRDAIDNPGRVIIYERG
tara:strand:- start:281 stop:493 length:213 start_codon:yes stop_codon:yes gene_type:complete